MPKRRRNKKPAKKQAPPPEPAPGVLPPPERGQHDILRQEPTERAGQTRSRVETQTMIERYYHDGLLSAGQRDVGKWLQGVFIIANCVNLKASSYEFRIPGRQAMTDPQVDASQTIDKLYEILGRDEFWLLFHVCACDGAAGDWAKSKGRGKNKAMSDLRDALDSLQHARSRIYKY